MAEIAVRLKAPSVIGELAAGVILGPSLLGWLQPNDVLKLLAEIGIILLLFEVGLETDVRRLANSGRESVAVAVGGFLVPFVLAVRTVTAGIAVYRRHAHCHQHRHHHPCISRLKASAGKGRPDCVGCGGAG